MKKYVIAKPVDYREPDNLEILCDDECNVLFFKDKDAAVDHLLAIGCNSQHELELCKILGSIGTCRRCGGLLFPSIVDGYTSQCFDCDEDFYSIEQETEIE